MTTRKAIALIAAAIITSFTTMQNAAASITSYAKNPDGVTLTLDNGSMKVKICKEDIIEVQYTILPKIPSKTSLVINNEWAAAPKFEVMESPEEIIISTGRIKSSEQVDKFNQIYDLNDVVILAEDAADGKKMAADSVPVFLLTGVETQFLSPADEALYGLGCHPVDSLAMNYKGRNQDMAIKYMTGAIPVLLSTKGYGLLWDNYAASNFYGAEAGNTKYKYVSESGTTVDIIFSTGRNSIILYRCTGMQQDRLRCSRNGLSDFFSRRTDIRARQKCVRKKQLPEK